MTKTNELKNKLAATFADKANHDKHITIDGDDYIYISCRNEIRRVINHENRTQEAVLVGCFAFGRFKWCC